METVQPQIGDTIKFRFSQIGGILDNLEGEGEIIGISNTRTIFNVKVNKSIFLVMDDEIIEVIKHVSKEG